MIGLALLASASLYAQKSEPQKPEKTGNEWKMPGDVVQRSHYFADSLKKLFNLDNETTKKLFDAYMANTKSVDEIGVMESDEKERKEKLKAILSPEQFEKYLKDDAKQRR